MDDLSNQLEWYKDEWQFMSDELDQCQDDLQEEKRVCGILKDKISKLQFEVSGFRYEAVMQNKIISDRAAALSNLVDEYDRILDRYVCLTNTKLITNKLNQLRKHGGYSQL